jgi:hypothetical protein
MGFGSKKPKGPTAAEMKLRRVQAAQASALRLRERDEKRRLASSARANAAARASKGAISRRRGSADLIASAFGSELSSKMGRDV